MGTGPWALTVWPSSSFLFFLDVQIPLAAAIFFAKPQTPIVWPPPPWSSSPCHPPGPPGS